jgi:hypothetical protein
MRPAGSAALSRIRTFAIGSALLFGAAAFWMALHTSVAKAQTPPQVQPAPQALHAASAASRPSLAKPAVPVAKAVKQQTKPLWTELTPAHQQALSPLSATWNTLNEAQKRKWLALSQNYPKMSGAEQGKLHSRMSEWAALSPQQRTQARLNFGETQQISPDDKKAKWEAYQALPEEEKNRLAAKAAKAGKPPSTAAAVKPVPAEKLATVPQSKPVVKAPRIAGGVGQVDQNTLLPQSGPGAQTN